jgi:hypothetical protein
VESPRRPWPHPACLDEEDLLAQCTLTRSRSSGPGGQHRNKVESQVILLHTPTGLTAQAAERRTAAENKRVAVRRLRLTLAVEHRCPVPRGGIGSDLWKSRRSTPPRGKTEEIFPGIRVRIDPAGGAEGRPAGAPLGRIACNPDHHDYPALLAEALDVIADANWDTRRAAARLEVSASQLLKLVKDHPPALLRLNAERAARGERPLK